MTANEVAARRLAERFRSKHGLGRQPIRDVFEVVYETTGIDVLSVDAGEAEHGLAMRDPASATIVIAVATTSNPMRQRSSVAHELGHVLAGDLEADVRFKPGSRSQYEVRADAFARHLLLPVSSLQVDVKATRPNIAVLSDLVQEFGVSPALASIQLREVGLVDSARAREWASVTTRSLAASNGWLDQYTVLVAASTHPRAPQGLMRRAASAYQAGLLGLAELATWYGRPEDDLREMLGDPNPGADSRPPIGDDGPLFPTGSSSA